MASKYLEMNVKKGMQDQYIEIDQKNYRIEKEEGGICAWHESFESVSDFEVRMNCVR